MPFMRWRLRLPFFFLSTVWMSLLAGSPAGAATACEKTLRWNEDPPYSQRRADGEIEGINVDAVREALRRMGCSVRLLEMPWARALAELEAGRLDILPGALQSLERERFARFSVPGPQSPNMLFTLVDAGRQPAPKQLSDLRGRSFRLGVQIGVSYGPEYEALMRDAAFARQVQQVSQRRSLWMMLDAGRLDGVLADEMTGRLEISQLGLQQRIRKTGVTVIHAPAAVAFSRTSVPQDFVERYNRTQEAMQQDGSLKAIWLKYSPTP